MAEEHASPINQAPQVQEPLQGEQAPIHDEDALTQGMRAFFQPFRDQQQDQAAAREQGMGF